ncbi:protein misato homolog 1 isoform X2 [Dermacentor albipictus]|uniref:protein misato homolog 1 isoform X2 n=1 Tax=Dermacentor albipictus TaxID=60249 RepID=UPI0031FC904A
MSCREVITLQLGHYANFVGSHIWNLQEACFSYKPNDKTIPLEFAHDIFFREGRNPKGNVTYTPRLLIADLRGSLGNLKTTGSLYDPPPSSANEAIAWSGKVTIHKAEPETKVPSGSSDKGVQRFPADQDKDVCRVGHTPQLNRQVESKKEPVQLWSEFLGVQLHPRTIHLITHYLHNNPDDPFDLFGIGNQCVEDHEWRNSFMDDVRWFAEDCDSLQAFNILLDGHNGFTGLTSSLLEILHDDYPNKSSICWPLFQPLYNSINEGRVAVDMAHRHFNTVMCYHSLNRLSSAFCPLSVSISHFQPFLRDFKHLQFAGDLLPYDTSGVLGLALDNLMCALKLKSQPLEVPELVGQLCSPSKKLCVLGMGLPLGLGELQLLADWTQSSSLAMLTPGARYPAPSATNLAVMRGCTTNMVSKSPRRVQDPSEVVWRFAERVCEGSITWLRQVENPSRITLYGFPDIFGPFVTSTGLISCQARGAQTGVDHVPSLTCLQNGLAASDVVSEVVHRGRQLDLGRFHRCAVAGTEPDLYREALHSVQELGSS